MKSANDANCIQVQPIQEDHVEPLLPHYVYVLLDPLKDNQPFYVGKGTGTRVQQHVAEVKLKLKKALEENATSALSCAKQERIAKILNGKLAPLEVILGRFETAEEAFAVEAIYIHQVIGYDNLTNIASGHGSQFIRTKEQFELICKQAISQESIALVDGIDQNRIRGIRDGSYRNEKIKGLTEAFAYEHLSALQQALTDANISWRDYTQPGDSAFHPGESNGYLSVIVEIGGLDLNVQFSKTKKLSTYVIFTNRTRQSSELDHLKDDHCQYRIGEEKKDGAYARFMLEQNDNQTNSNEDISGMVKWLLQFHRYLIHANLPEYS